MRGMYNKKKAMSLHRRRKALLIIFLSFFILMKDIYTSGTEKIYIYIIKSFLTLGYNASFLSK